MADSIEQGFVPPFSLESEVKEQVDPSVIWMDMLHDEQLMQQERMRHPVAFHTEMLGDEMYYHQAIKQPDAANFIKALIKEVNSHLDKRHL